MAYVSNYRYPITKVEIIQLQLDTHVIARQFRDKQTGGEPIRIENFVIDRFWKLSRLCDRLYGSYTQCKQITVVLGFLKGISCSSDNTSRKLHIITFLAKRERSKQEKMASVTKVGSHSPQSLLVSTSDNGRLHSHCMKLTVVQARHANNESGKSLM